MRARVSRGISTPGTPSENGPTIHLVVPDTLDAARARLTGRRHGWCRLSPDIEIPPGKFFYAKDLDGNSIGLFEMKA
jgi:hypothetical protein